MGATLVHYDRGEDGVAVLTLTAPPANTYSYEMMRQLDAAILEARMDDGVQVLVLRGDGEKFLLRRGGHRDALGRDSALQVLLLSSRERDALQQQLFESEDAREGLSANLEKRKPRFKGR